MGYFSNGTEGDVYQEQYCERCANEQNANILGDTCPIWIAHLNWNYDQHKNKEVKSILDLFIPREGIVNKQCVMFTPITPAS